MPKRYPHLVPFVVTLLLGAVAAVLLTWPQAFGAQHATPIAQVLAFRAPLAIMLGIAAVAAVVVAVLRRRWSVAAGLAFVLGAASLGNGAILLDRGYGGSAPEGDLTVVAWNTQGGAASPESIARLVVETGADVVSLPETDETVAAEVARLVAQEGLRFTPDTTYGPRGDSRIPTSVLIADDLGEYRQDVAAGSTPGLPSAVWLPVDGTGPTIIAAHPMPPLPGAVGQWSAGLDWVAAQCGTADVIVAGDLNATVDHLSGGALAEGCQDAATEAGAAALGTWPASIAPWFAAPIDHVLGGSAWSVRGAKVLTSLDGAGSDHRPIVAVLGRR